MANTFDDKADSYSAEVKNIHGAAAGFIRKVRYIKDNIGTNYAEVFKIPPAVTGLLRNKTAFDALNIPGVYVKRILENDLGYTDWTAQHTTDFNAIFTKALALRTAVENNIDVFTPSFVDHKVQYVTAPANVQTALTALLDDILASVIQD